MLELSPIGIVVVLLAILLSMAWHEAAHAYAGHVLGDTTAYDQGRLTLNPLKHIDLATTILLPLGMMLVGLQPFFIAKPVQFNPYKVKGGEYGAALVGLAGPFSNLVLAGLSALIVNLFSLNPESLPYLIFATLTLVNIGFFVFNMIPFPPLDGSRLLYAFAPEGLQNIMLRIEAGGLASIFIFMFVIYGFIAPVIARINQTIIGFLL